jgi:hypothetical protein
VPKTEGPIARVASGGLRGRLGDRVADAFGGLGDAFRGLTVRDLYRAALDVLTLRILSARSWRPNLMGPKRSTYWLSMQIGGELSIWRRVVGFLRSMRVESYVELPPMTVQGPATGAPGGGAWLEAGNG